MNDPSQPVADPGSQQTPPDLTGSSLGGYTVLRRLGQGGMADVYLATQESLGRSVALKVLKPSLAQDRSYVKRFHNEAKSVAALVHPHIVQVYEVGAWGDLHFIAQEYVPGDSLRQRLLRERSLPLDQALAIMAAVSAALEKASQCGIVHRDIKPDNILLGSHGSVKVADFGLARNTQAGAMELTQTGVTMGTPLYMSPEQIEGRALDGRSDIYSLGVTAYHMLAGRVPFEGETPLAVAMKHVSQAPQPLAEVRSGVPLELSQLVDRMLAKSPKSRPDSGAAVLEELRAIGRGLPTFGDQSVSMESSMSSAAQALDRAFTRNRQSASPWWRAPRLLSGLGLGMVLAVLLLGRDPLRPTAAERALGVPRKSNASKQYFYAMHVNSEEAWRAVLDYFPAGEAGFDEMNRLYNLRAKQQLARYYLAHQRSREAKVLVAELAGLGETDREFRLFGLAWQAIIAAQEGEKEHAISLLADVWADRGELDGETSEHLSRVHRQLLGDGD